MIAIVVSRADSASEHVGEHLLSLGEWERRVDDARPEARGGGEVFRTDGFELRTFEEMHLDLDDAAAAFDDPEMLVFASRHAGETGPLLTAHFTGNFGPAEFGGRDRALARACPNALSRVVEAFEAHAPPEYDAGVECTHHGPSEVGVPSMFVELGSGERQWEDPDGARAVARSILDLRGVSPHRERRAGDALGAGRDGDESQDADPTPEDAPRRHVVGFGGGHYAPRFLRVIRETDWAVGHVAADWCLDDMGAPDEHRDVLRQAFERSDAEFALLADTERDTDDLVDAIEALGYRVVEETWLREVDDVPLATAERLEAELSSVAEGLRFGAPARDYRGEFAAVELPEELLATAQGIDAEAVRAAVEDAALAFETAEAGNRVRGRAAFALPDDADVGDPDRSAVDLPGYDALIDDLSDLLGEKYDAVERREGLVRAEETAFDPARARQAGVPEGPAFGKLSNGQPVTVDGETVRPEDVERERVDEFPV